MARSVPGRPKEVLLFPLFIFLPFNAILGHFMPFKTIFGRFIPFLAPGMANIFYAGKNQPWLAMMITPVSVWPNSFSVTGWVVGKNAMSQGCKM